MLYGFLFAGYSVRGGKKLHAFSKNVHIGPCFAVLRLVGAYAYMPHNTHFLALDKPFLAVGPQFAPGAYPEIIRFLLASIRRLAAVYGYGEGGHVLSGLCCAADWISRQVPDNYQLIDRSFLLAWRSFMCILK